MRESLFERGPLKCVKHTYPWEVCRKLESGLNLTSKTQVWDYFIARFSLCVHSTQLEYCMSLQSIFTATSSGGEEEKSMTHLHGRVSKGMVWAAACRAKLQEWGKDRKACLLKLHWLRLTKSWPPQCQHLADYTHTLLQNQENTGAGRLIQEASWNGHRVGLGWEPQHESSALLSLLAGSSERTE